MTGGRPPDRAATWNGPPPPVDRPREGHGAPGERKLTVQRLGRTRYEPVLKLQRRLQADMYGDAKSPAVLLLTEHEPVFTLGRNHPNPDLRVPASAVAAAGIPIIKTERGGDITYHGPGQLVAYAIVNLRTWGLGAVDFVSGLEESAVRALAGYGIRAQRQPGARGAWVGSRKIASVGVNVRRGVSMHGLALNVNPDLEHFAMINACGLAGVEATSIMREAGTDPGVEATGSLFAVALARSLGCTEILDSGHHTGLSSPQHSQAQLRV